MKNTLWILILIFSYVLAGKTQVRPETNEKQITLQQMEIPGFTQSIPFSSLETVKKSWVKTTEKGSKEKVAFYDGSEMILNGWNIKGLGDSGIMVYSKLLPEDSSVILLSAFEGEPGVFIESANYPAEAQVLKNFLFDFAIEQYAITIKDELKQEEKVLKELNRDLNTKLRDKEKMEKGITQYNNEILIAKDQIVGYEYDVQMKQDQINSQKTKISKISPSNTELVKQEQTALKNLEKEKKKNFKAIEKNQKMIVEYKNKIQQNNLDINTNLLEQEKLRTEIFNQSRVIEEVETRLSNVLSMKL